MVVGVVRGYSSKVKRYATERFESVESWWMPVTALVVTFLVLSVGSVTIPSLSLIVALYAGYRSYGKQVPSQALGTGFYFIALLYMFALQFNSFVGFLLLGFVSKRYAFRKHPDEAFRRPLGSASGYYYNPRKVGFKRRLLVEILLFVLGFKYPLIGKIPSKILKRPLLILAGLEVEPSELEENDVLYYLHEDSPGSIANSNDESETVEHDLPNVTIESD